MIRRTTWILLAVLAVLLIAAWLLQSGRINLGKQEEPTATPGEAASLFSFQSADVQRVRVEAVGALSFNATSTAEAQETALATLTRTPTSTPTLAVTGTVTATTVPSNYTEVAFEKDPNGAWTGSEPKANLSDAGAVESAVSGILLASPLNVLESSPPPGVIGLDPPRYRVIFILKDEAEHNLSIGSMTPTGSGYYVQVDSGPLAVVSSFAVQSLVDLLDNPPLAPTKTPAQTQTPVPSLTPTQTLTPTRAPTLTRTPAITRTSSLTGTVTKTP